MSPSKYRRIVSRMIEAAGHASQSFGLGRVVGQIFAYLYFSREARTLDHLTAALGISKGSASMCVRQLEQWGALERIWIKGDRKDYYRARDTLGQIIRNIVVDLAGKKIESSALLLRIADAELTRKKSSGRMASREAAFIQERISKISAFQEKAQGMWDGAILKMMLK